MYCTTKLLASLEESCGLNETVRCRHKRTAEAPLVATGFLFFYYRFVSAEVDQIEGGLFPAWVLWLR